MFSIGLPDFHKSTCAAAQTALLARWQRGNEGVVKRQRAGMALSGLVANVGAYSGSPKLSILCLPSNCTYSYPSRLVNDRNKCVYELKAIWTQIGASLHQQILVHTHTFDLSRFISVWIIFIRAGVRIILFVELYISRGFRLAAWGLKSPETSNR